MTSRERFGAYGAWAAVCFFWGTTYLGIAVGLESFQPTLFAGLRFLIAGSLLFFVMSRQRGARLPIGREWFDFAGWRWAAFDTGGGTVTLFNEAGDSHLGVYRPKDGRDGLHDLPETGIAFLDVIPAIGSKFQTPSQLGPQSRQRHVSGTTRGSVLFRFGAFTERQK